MSLSEQIWRECHLQGYSHKGSQDSSISVPCKWQKFPGWSSGGLQCLLYDSSESVDSVCRKCHHKFLPSRYLQSEDCFPQQLPPCLTEHNENTKILGLKPSPVRVQYTWSQLAASVCLYVCHLFISLLSHSVSSWSMQGYSLHGII